MFRNPFGSEQNIFYIKNKFIRKEKQSTRAEDAPNLLLKQKGKEGPLPQEYEKVISYQCCLRSQKVQCSYGTAGVIC